PGADLFVALPGSDALQHFDFASTQCFATHTLRQLGRESWWNAGLTGVYFADAFHQRFASGILQQVTFGAGLYRAIDILISIKCREHDNVSAWIEFADFLNRPDTVQFRHTQIEQRHIGAMFFPKIDGFAAITGFPDNGHISFAFN